MSADQEQNHIHSESNELLRRRMAHKGLSKAALSRATGLDERTIQRSMDGETIPQAQNARAIADALDCEPHELWPSAKTMAVSVDGLVAATLYASRAHIPVSVWLDLFTNATTTIDICVYGGTFLFDVIPGFNRLIAEAADRGVQVRFVAGDPGSNAIHQRGMEENIGTSLAGRCALTLDRLTPIAELENVEIRVHGTPLYASLFRADDTVVANHHIYGSPASDNPAMLLRRDSDEALWQKYEVSFEKVWSRARLARYTDEGVY